MEPHLSRHDQELRALLLEQRVAALGTLDDAGHPFVSLVPFAWSHGLLVLHVSGLAAHTRHLAVRPQASLLVHRPEQAGQGVHALSRVTLSVQAQPCDLGTDVGLAARAAYLTRFPEAEPMTALPDFRFLVLRPLEARQVAGFGAARSLDVDALGRCLT